MTEKKRPGEEGISKRDLHFIWLADCSSSMGLGTGIVAGEGEKIQALNQAIKEAIPHMRQTAADNPFAEVLVRAIKFSGTATWHIAQPVPVEQFQWPDLEASGTTAMGEALRLVAEALKVENIGKRAFPPVLALVSDGQPTDDFKGGLKQLMQEPWGKKAVRVAIAIGKDADWDVLQQFIGHSEYKPFEANSPEALARAINFVSTSVLKSASAPPSSSKEQAVAGNVPVPQPPPKDVSEKDVW